MQVETHISTRERTTFIVADNEEESAVLKEIAPETVRLVAVLEPQGNYRFPYLKIVYKGTPR